MDKRTPDLIWGPLKGDLDFIQGHLEESKLKEHYSHVTTRIEWMWGSVQCLQYLEDLAHYNDRNHRAGFPFEVFLEIRELIRIHKNKFPDIKCRDDDIWALAELRRDKGE